MLWAFVSEPNSANRTSALVANRLAQEVRTASRVSGATTDPYDTINSTTSYTESKPYSMATRKEPHMDVTVTDTVADSYLHRTSAKAGGAAENAATRKEDKYVGLQQTYTFIPLAIETLGSINVKGVEFLQELRRRLAAISEDNP